MTTTTNTATQTNFKLFVVFALLVLSTGVFAQNNTPAQVSVTTTVTTNVIATENAVATTTMDFAVWFTGTQTTNETKSNGTAFSKKQLINSGINTNSVLIRSFLKKINAQGSSIA